MATKQARTFKVILYGQYGVGKSSLFRRFMDNSFKMSSDPTSSIGLDFFSKTYTVDDTMVELTLWDTGGMEKVSSVTASYYKGAGAAIVCYSISDKESFNILSQYILDIAMYSETAKVFLCGIKMDEQSDDPVTDEEIEEFSRQCSNALSGIYKISNKTGEGIKEMFQDIAKCLYEDAVGRPRVGDGGLIRPHQDDENESKCRC